MVTRLMELSALHKVAEIADGEVDDQQFMIKSAILPLSWAQLP